MRLRLPRLNVVLWRPVIPWNTGNAGRTCLGFGAALHLIAPAFDVSAKGARRAGLDYWQNVDLHVHEDWEEFASQVLQGPHSKGSGEGNDECGAFFFSKSVAAGKHGDVPLERVDFFPPSGPKKVALVFGAEQRGLDGVPPEAMSHRPIVFFPMHSDAIRSYNLSSSVAMGVCEAYRQMTLLQT